MIYYAAISGNDIIGHRETLNAATLTGAKREAMRRFGGGYRHHMVWVGELIDAGTRNERGRPLSSRPLAPGNRWRDEA